MVQTLAALERIALGAGLCAFGATSAEPFTATHSDLEARKTLGLHGGMQFTYRNPSRSTDPSRSLPGATTLLVGAYDYQRVVPARPAGHDVARIAAYSWEDHYAVLRVALEEVAAPLRDAGNRAIVLADENNLVDRAVAHRAGIGWWGKSSNVLVPGVGSLVVLGSVLTDAVIDRPEAPTVADGCASCSACLSGCPTGAIIDSGVVDARRCLAWLLQVTGPFPVEHRIDLGDRIYGCDDCQDVCPPNRLRKRQPSDAVEDGAWVSVLEMLALEDRELIERFGRWYIPDRNADYLRRNALVVLGNIGRGGDPAVAKALHDALAHPASLVRAHAVWAARRLGRDDLLVGLGGDDPDVEIELSRPHVPVA